MQSNYFNIDIRYLSQYNNYCCNLYVIFLYGKDNIANKLLKNKTNFEIPEVYEVMLGLLCRLFSHIVYFKIYIYFSQSLSNL